MIGMAVHVEVIGLGGLPAVLPEEMADAVMVACVVEMFVAILTLTHCLPTGLLCVTPHLLQ